MGDLYLHLAFARRLRFAEGLHPVVREALVRRSPYLALGATLAQLPSVEVRSGGFFRRLFKLGKNDADRWQQRLEPEAGASADFAVALLEAGSGPKPGPLTRVAMGMGALSHQLLGAAVAETVKDLTGAEREAVELGQARLWTQNAVPVQRHLQDEWAPALAFFNLEAAKPALGHVASSMQAAFGESPSKELLGRWGRALAQTLLPLVEKCALPDPGPIPDHTVREQYFDGDARFLERTADVTAQLVYLSGQIGELFLEEDPPRDKIREALVEDAKLRAAPAPATLEKSIGAWHQHVVNVRTEIVCRGRNPQAAYLDNSGPVQLSVPPLPADGAAPTVTQEVSLAQIEAEIGAKAPTMTQEVSLAQIEDELGQGGDDAGEAASPGSKPPAPPTSTQQVSLDDIEAEVAAQSDGATPPPGLQAPAHTQQVSVDDIEAEVAAQSEGATPPPGLQAPAHTQQVSLDDIEAEVEAQTGGAGPGLQAPAHTQQVSLDDIEAEVAAQTDAGPAGGSKAGPPGPPPVSGEGAPVPPQSDEGPPMPPPHSGEHTDDDTAQVAAAPGDEAAEAAPDEPTPEAASADAAGAEADATPEDGAGQDNGASGAHEAAPADGAREGGAPDEDEPDGVPPTDAGASEDSAENKPAG